MGYTAEEVGRALSLWANSHERLTHGCKRPLEGVAVAVDLDIGIREIDERLKRRLARFIRLGYEPPRREGNRYPSPDELLLVVRALQEQDEKHEAHQLARVLKDIRLLILVAKKMSLRRERPPIDVRVDRRLMGWVCPICVDLLAWGVLVTWDRDRGLAWHPACAFALQQRLDGATIATLTA